MKTKIIKKIPLIETIISLRAGPLIIANGKMHSKKIFIFIASDIFKFLNVLKSLTTKFIKFNFFLR